ncbi:MAG: Oligopeptide transport ATP-binding protein OppF [Candidatus Ozemobacter sibiricus]|uniref:Oligopeptide transport ATP-binding protein OppF n=1 Tax=Candidatus Ozemobacter sibiricus TaxID=2268124 RepID=A0A367ZRT0_9BACT|nr:MAG: Oligopeptide transport ATP-binding protein OppF [Candidatus Ozemobacter sibiricus]
MLVVEGLTKRFPLEQPPLRRLRDWWRGRPPPVLTALQDVSFTVGARETLGILGESGSGKSTLARVLMGLYQPEAGRAFLLGEDLFTNDPKVRHHHRRRMQMVFQDPFGSLDPRMSIRRILAEPLAIHRPCPEAEWEGLMGRGLEEVGLDRDALDRYPAEFSGGQRQRISICRALILDPVLLIADEAVSALDVSVQAQILELLMRLKEGRGLSLIFISHDVAVVRQVADRVLVLYKGVIVESLPASCLLEDATHPYTQRLLGAALYLRENREFSAWEGSASQKPRSEPRPEGCPCQSWCDVAEARCGQPPPEVEVHPGHRVRCWRGG